MKGAGPKLMILMLKEETFQGSSPASYREALTIAAGGLSSSTLLIRTDTDQQELSIVASKFCRHFKHNKRHDSLSNRIAIAVVSRQKLSQGSLDFLLSRNRCKSF